MVFAIFKKSGEVDIGGGQPSTPETPSLSTSELVLHRKSHSRWKYMFLAALVVIFAILLPVIIWFAARPGIDTNETTKVQYAVQYGNETCDFEYRLGKERCHWTQDTSDDFDWTRHSGSTPSYGGPTHDHTVRNSRDANGYYLYIKASVHRYKERARITSRMRSPTSGSCLVFWYNMNGKSIGNLTAYTIANGVEDVIWRKGGNFKNRWLYAAVPLTSSMSYQLAIEGTVGSYRGSTLFGDIAIDDISILIGSCPIQAPLVCNYTHSINATYGYFTSPFYPEYYPDNALCYYHLETRPGKIFTIAINSFRLQQSPSCANDSVRMYEKGTVVATMCGSSHTRKTLTSSGNKVLFVFQSDGSVAGQGFNMRFQTKDRPCVQTFSTSKGYFMSPGYQSRQPTKSCLYHIIVGRERSVKLDVVMFSESKSCSYGYIMVYEDRFTARNVKATYCGNISTTFQSYSHAVTVQFQTFAATAQRFYANYSISHKACNFILQKPSTTFASPSYPNIYPNNVTCQYHFKVAQNEAVRIFFAFFSLQETPSCTRDSVKLYQKNILMATFCGTQSTRSWSSTESEVLMVFKSDGSISSSGFYGTFSPINKPCRYEYSELKGFFTTPGYPHKYKDDMACSYSIKVQQNGTIEIDFQVFDLEYSATCERDFVKIYDILPSRSDLSATYCGQVTRKFESKSNEVLVQFKSDGSVAGQGFYASYKVIETGSSNATSCKESLPKCSHSFMAPTGNFSSPGYPNRYPNNTCCAYQIAVKKGASIVLDFLAFSLEYEPRCNYDSIKIFEGEAASRTLMRTFCGNGTKTYTSRGNTLYVLFKSDFSKRHQGFLVRYSTTNTRLF